MNKAIFWDFDGTLSYPNKSFSTALYDALMENGYNTDYEKTVKFTENAYSWKSPDVTYADKTDERWWDDLYKKISDFCMVQGISENLQKICESTRRILTDVSNYCLYDDTVETLQKCIDMGYKNYLVTNNYPEIIKNLEKLGIAKYFTAYTVSAHIGYEKPRKEFFDCAKTLAGSPDVGYIIGDNPNADIKGGRAAGFTAIAVHECRESEADYYCEELTEIFNILK